jgi:UDP-N-acetylmuramate dehydrogenase
VAIPESQLRFEQLTTMRVGGPIGELLTPTSTPDLIDLLRKCGDATSPLLVMGGGSNLIVGDEGWPGTVIRIGSTELDIDGERVTAAAGVEWDHLVRTTIAEGLGGLESLSGIPGLVGGTPIQNVGAYGTLTSEVLERLRVYDRETREVQTWENEQCDFGPHRHSIFKHRNRWVVLDVTYRLRRTRDSKPLQFEALLKELSIGAGERVPVATVRDAVLGLRRQRGMVLDPEDQNTWSVGSFFVNPVVPVVPEPARDCPQWPDPHGVKLSAAWLIHQSGFAPGYGSEYGNGRVTLSSRHTLAITNRGGASTADIMGFASHIRSGVHERFQVRLTPECDLVNCQIPA